MAGELADALIARIDKLIADRLDAAITSRLAASSYMAPDNAGIAQIVAAVDTEVAAIKSKTDLIPVGGPPSGADFTATRAALLDNLDALISSRATATDVWAAATRTLTAAPSVIKSIQHCNVDLTSNIMQLTIAPINLDKAFITWTGVVSANTGFPGHGVRLNFYDNYRVTVSRVENGTTQASVSFDVIEFY